MDHCEIHRGLESSLVYFHAVPQQQQPSLFLHSPHIQCMDLLRALQTLNAKSMPSLLQDLQINLPVIYDIFISLSDNHLQEPWQELFEWLNLKCSTPFEETNCIEGPCFKLKRRSRIFSNPCKITRAWLLRDGVKPPDVKIGQAMHKGFQDTLLQVHLQFLI